MRTKIFLIMTLSLFTLLGCVDAQKEMDKIELQVAQDAEKQYEIAKSSGSAIDIYVAAGMVKAAYLQAEDEENYKKWVEIEKEAAKAAGIQLPE